jgi:hypothetical protein
MNHQLSVFAPNYVGIFELDTAGTVLYSRKSAANLTNENVQSPVGQNFFDQIADFENAPDFRRRFRNFITSHQTKENFHFECRSMQGNVPVRVLMLRATEKNDCQTNDIVILDIRKNEF